MICIEPQLTRWHTPTATPPNTDKAKTDKDLLLIALYLDAITGMSACRDVLFICLFEALPFVIDIRLSYACIFELNHLACSETCEHRWVHINIMLHDPIVHAGL
jgi:hypothetical protein